MKTYNLTEFRQKLHEALGGRELSEESTVLMHTDYVKSAKTFEEWVGREKEQSQLNRHQPFKEWHPKNLLNLLEMIQTHHPKQMKKFIDEYNEWLMGN